MEASIGAASSSWTIKTKNNNPIARYEPSLVTASDPFEDRLQAFATEPKTRRFLQGLHMQSVNELKRRNAERQARKASNGTSAVQSSPATTTETTAATATASPRMSDTVGAKSHSLSNNKDNRTISDEFKPFQFLNVNVLPPVEQKAWQTIRGDQSITYPHQWVRLASLFSIQSKTLRQPSLLTSQNELAAIEDCGGQKPLIESYMKIRDTQNRNYARNSVNEGIAAFKQKNVQGALNCYKRALDMDPKYAEGWFRVAEGLLYQKNKAEAIENLERALKADPSHAEAQVLLENIQVSQKQERGFRRRGDSSVERNRHSLSRSSHRAKREGNSADRDKRRRRRREDEDKRRDGDSRRESGDSSDDDSERALSSKSRSRRRSRRRHHRDRDRDRQRGQFDGVGDSAEGSCERGPRKRDDDYHKSDHSVDRRSRRRRRDYSKDHKHDHRRQDSHSRREQRKDDRGSRHHRHHHSSGRSNRLHSRDCDDGHSDRHQDADSGADPLDTSREDKGRGSSISDDPMSNVEEPGGHHRNGRNEISNLDGYESHERADGDENHISGEKRKYDDPSGSDHRKKQRGDEHKSSRRREKTSLERHRRRHHDEKAGSHRNRSHRRHSRSSPRRRR